MIGSQRRWSLFTDGVVVASVALIGLALGLQPIKDNSAFTHLATGLRMVHRGFVPAIPRVDPYTYTAQGHDWTVQSWMPSWVLGLLYRHVGAWAVLVLAGVSFAAVAALMAAVARTGRAWRSAVAVGLALVVGAPFWAPRPLMAGLVCLGLAILVLERRWSPRWLVALGWVWVQSHGSFPLGVAFFLAVAVGTWIDARSWRAGGAEVRALAAITLGVALGAVNPLGPKLVVFPVTVLSKREVFSHIVEWKPLSFATHEGAIAIVGLTVAVVVLIRRRVPLRVVVPVIGFVGLAFSAQRNVAPLALVLAWALGHALRDEAAATEPQRLDRFVGLAIAALATVFVVSALSGPALSFRAYPVQSIAWAERYGRFAAPHRVLSRDFVGNFLELRHGPSADVFIDDRVDMFPTAVSHDYLDLLHNSARSLAVLDRWKVDTVVWPADDGLTRRLRANGWTVAHREKLAKRWVVLFRS